MKLRIRRYKGIFTNRKKIGGYCVEYPQGVVNVTIVVYCTGCIQMAWKGKFIYKYEVHSTAIFAGSRVSDFAGNSRAQNIIKAKTKRANIMGVQYFSAYQQGVVSSTLYFIIYHLSSFYPPHNFVPNFPFFPPPPQLTDTTSPWIGQSYDFMQPCLQPTTKKANSTIITSPAAAKLSAQLTRFHRCNHCLQPATSYRDLVPLGDILNAAGGRLLFHGHSSAVDADITH